MEFIYTDEVTSKLKKVKQSLKVWNHPVVGSFQPAIDAAQAHVRETQSKVTTLGFSDVLFQDEMDIDMFI